MLIGYARVSKADGSQSLDLQRDALRADGVDAGHVYHLAGPSSRRSGSPCWLLKIHGASTTDVMLAITIARCETDANWSIVSV